MKKLHAPIVFLIICICILNSCKKDISEKTVCETKFTVEGYALTNRFNDSGHIVGIESNDDSYTYTYKKNKVVVHLNGNETYTITLENGRAVKFGITNSNEVENISYDDAGRIKQILIGDPKDLGNIYTYSYRNGKIDRIKEELKTDKLKDRSLTYEYSDIKVDSRTQVLQSYFGSVLSNSLPVTLRGTLSTHLPSKVTYTETARGDSYAVVYTTVTDYNYIKSSDGKISGVNMKETMRSYSDEKISNRTLIIESTCN